LGQAGWLASPPGDIRAASARARFWPGSACCRAHENRA